MDSARWEFWNLTLAQQNHDWEINPPASVWQILRCGQGLAL
jgi:hypothetical protein